MESVFKTVWKMLAAVTAISVVETEGAVVVRLINTVVAVVLVVVERIFGSAFAIVATFEVVV